jgi:hypothetical protein
MYCLAPSLSDCFLTAKFFAAGLFIDPVSGGASL